MADLFVHGGGSGYLPAARDCFDAVCHDAVKPQSHLRGVRIECEYAEGRN
jgi:hypothetical protein